MYKSRLTGALCVGVLTFITTTSQATLIGALPVTPNGTDYQAYYDNVADLTWLANANAAGTTMTWDVANTWAAGLDINDVTGWRLPDTLQPDSTCGSQGGTGSYGVNCTGSEMGNLFYNVLGGVANVSIATTHNSNYNLFSNVQYNYWSSTGLPSSDHAWYFSFGGGGLQVDLFKNTGINAWAVHTGNIGAVPVPAAAWLFGSGLLGLIGVVRKKAA